MFAAEEGAKVIKDGLAQQELGHPKQTCSSMLNLYPVLEVLAIEETGLSQYSREQYWAG